MQPRAFVVMPFGKKTPGKDFGGHRKARRRPLMVDFDRIYQFLFKPALEKAGFEVTRADSAANAGDIRTDMFFELVTADLVVADISVLNPNVYYELGVRHGVCPRGVFVVSASVAPPPPFDVAPDRRFTYDVDLFVRRIPHKTKSNETEKKEEGRGRDRTASHAPDRRARAEVDRLAKTFHDARTLDRQSVGSPVYAHLPGLKPVDWELIETSKAKYFNALQSDWMDCVKWAQANGRPGDILTLAQNAPTRFHEVRILSETAVALIDLCRYAAAEGILAEVVRLDPECRDAQLSLALVTAHLGWSTSAEHRLRKILEEHSADPTADDLLAQVLRQLWRLSWQTKEKLTLARRREKAVEASQLAVSAIHRFARAHRADPKEYFAGFNALVLAFVLKKIDAPASEIRIGSRDAAAVDLRALHKLVHYTATSEQQRALEEGDYVKQFWCTTTLAGLLLIGDHGKAALLKIEEACAIPAATSYQLQTLRDRLGLLVDLGVGTEYVRKALTIIEATLQLKIGHCGCERVVLWHGYGVGRPGQKHARFSEPDVRRLSDEIGKALEEWGVTNKDLAICSGMTESDIIFAEACLKRKARVRIMLREPTDAERERMPQWPPLASPAWRERLHTLRTRADTGLDVWIDTDHLGPVRPGDDGSATFVVRRHKQWLINTAKMEASPTFRPDETSRAKKQMTTLHGLFLWDGSRASGDPDDSSDFVREVTRFNGYRGEVKIIDLTKNAMHVKKKTARVAKRSPSKPVVHARKPLRPQFAVGGARS
jgi:hypothetical protein